MRFSIVVPTHQRRDTVSRNIAALEAQVDKDFEVIVVVDGSTDGTAEELRRRRRSFPITVLEQENQGAAAARNAGAKAASGEILLFLDDDMEAHPTLLSEHQRAHRAGADVVIGDIPLHPESPRNLLSLGVGRWAQGRCDRLSRPGAAVRADDVASGHMSISRHAFAELGGFDVSLTRRGRYGGEDVDLGCRIFQAGLRVVFNPAAISYQFYDVAPTAFLHRAYEAGQADRELRSRYTDSEAQLGRRRRFQTRRSRWLFGPFVVLPAPLSRPLRSAVAALVAQGRRGVLLQRLFLAVRTVEHLRGERATPRSRSATKAVVLAYHAVADLSQDPVLSQYGVPPARFAAHMETLRRRGWSFISLDALLRALDGQASLPRRALLVTFDDGYEDLLHSARPLLMERRIPAVAFAVAGHVGAVNEWDRSLGAGTRRLLDAEGLRALARGGIEIGAHGFSHRPLPQVADDELRHELIDAATALEAVGLGTPRALAYPYGACSPAVAQAAREAGYSAAFTTRPGTVGRGTPRYELPRIEVLANDGPAKLRCKLAIAGLPGPWRRLAARLLPGGF